MWIFTVEISQILVTENLNPHFDGVTMPGDEGYIWSSSAQPDYLGLHAFGNATKSYHVN